MDGSRWRFHTGGLIKIVKLHACGGKGMATRGGSGDGSSKNSWNWHRESTLLQVGAEVDTVPDVGRAAQWRDTTMTANLAPLYLKRKS
jgi:hypothetical protein